MTRKPSQEATSAWARLVRVQQSLQSYTARYEARVTVHAPAAEIAGRRWLGGDVTPLDDGRCELRTSDDNLDWLAMRIAMISAPYVVHEPPEVIERLQLIAERIAGGTVRSPT